MLAATSCSKHFVSLKHAATPGLCSADNTNCQSSCSISFPSTDSGFRTTVTAGDRPTTSKLERKIIWLFRTAISAVRISATYGQIWSREEILPDSHISCILRLLTCSFKVACSRHMEESPTDRPTGKQRNSDVSWNTASSHFDCQIIS
jgi:hypothetical protein